MPVPATLPVPVSGSLPRGVTRWHFVFNITGHPAPAGPAGGRRGAVFWAAAAFGPSYYPPCRKVPWISIRRIYITALQCRSVGLPPACPDANSSTCTGTGTASPESFQIELIISARNHSYVRVGSPHAPVRMSASKQKLRFTPAQVCTRVCAHVCARVCARARGRVCVRRRL